MQLVQILMPLFDNDGRKIKAESFRAVRAELVERFGGLTAYTRAPAEGLWANRPALGSGEGRPSKLSRRRTGDLEPRPSDQEQINRDQIIIIEVMVPELDRPWWQALRSHLEKDLRQEMIVIRAYPIELL